MVARCDVVRAVREVQAEDVHAGREQRIQHLGRAGGRTDGGDDPACGAWVVPAYNRCPPCARQSRSPCSTTSSGITRRSSRSSSRFAPKAWPPDCRWWTRPRPGCFARWSSRLAPSRILEVGTAIGYSATCMALALPADGAAADHGDGRGPGGHGAPELRARRRRRQGQRDRRRRLAVPAQGGRAVRSHLPGRQQAALRAAARPARRSSAARRRAGDRQRAVARRGRRRVSSTRLSATRATPRPSATTTTGWPATRGC